MVFDDIETKYTIDEYKATFELQDKYDYDKYIQMTLDVDGINNLISLLEEARDKINDG